MRFITSVIVSGLSLWPLAVGLAQPITRFNVKNFGAAGDGVRPDTEAINKAIAAAGDAGRGTVLVNQDAVTLTSGAVIAHLIRVAALAPAQDTPDRLLAAANAAYRSLRAAEAADLYRQYLALYPDRADVRVYFGGALLNLDQLQAAFEQARRAIELDQNYAKGYVLAGRVCAAREQWNQAQNYLATAERLDGRDADAWYFSGRAYYDANRFDQAIAVFEQALRIGAEQSRVYENLGLAQDALSQFNVAEKSFRKALELANGSWRPYLAYGAFLFRQNRPAESLRVLRQALMLAPAETDVRFELARVLYHEDNLAEASEVLSPTKASNQCRIHNLLARIDSARGESGLAEIEIKAMGNCQAPRESP